MISPRQSAGSRSLVVDGLVASYGRKLALAGLDLDLPDDARVGLIGVNGAGKSTLLRCLAGVKKADRGSISFGGERISTRRRDGRSLKHVAYMPQSLDAPPNLSPLQFVAYVTWLRGHARTDALKFAHEALERVFLSDISGEKMSSLSGGMLRRVALAQAIAGRPSALLLDEPSTGLDPEQRRVMVNILRDLDGSLVLLSSHVMEDVADIVERVLVLHRGSLLFSGPTEQLSELAPSGARNELEAGFLSLIESR